MKAGSTLALLALLGIAAGGTAVNATPALLFEPQSGKVLFAEDQDDLWHPASLTKIMTAYVAFDALKSGRLKPDHVLVFSEKATQQAPSKVGLAIGAEITAELALRAVIVKSANDAAMVLAESIAGSEEDFVRQMNDTAKRLGMTRTRFVNPNGLPAAEQVTTARDLAKLARALLRDFPEHAHLWAEQEVQVGKNKLKTHNGLLRTYAGADGIKTGFICDAGFNVVASATRENRKLIAVVLGDVSGRERNIRAASLLDHGFQTWDWKQIFNTKTIDNLPIPPDAKDVHSVRSTILAWDCGYRRKIPATAKKKVPNSTAAAKTQAKTAKAATNDKGGKSAANSPKQKSAKAGGEKAGSEKARQQ